MNRIASNYFRFLFTFFFFVSFISCRLKIAVANSRPVNVVWNWMEWNYEKWEWRMNLLSGGSQHFFFFAPLAHDSDDIKTLFMILFLFFLGLLLAQLQSVYYCSDVNGLIWTIMPLNHVAALNRMTPCIWNLEWTGKKSCFQIKGSPYHIRNENSQKSQLKSKVQSRFKWIESISIE